MRILQINNFLNLKGGSDKVFIETSNLLSSNKHDVAVFYAGDIPQTNPLNSAIIHYNTEDILSSSSNGLIKAKAFIKNKQALNDLSIAINDFNPQIIHLHIFQSRLSSAIISKIKEFNIPMVMSVHEYKMTCPVYTHLDQSNEICEKCKPSNYFPCIYNKCVDGSLSKSFLMSAESINRDLFHSYIDNIDRFIMVSKFILEKHAEVYPNQRNKFTHLYNFVDHNQFNGEPIFGNYVLYFGRLSKEKGIDDLLIAASKTPNIEFKIAGTGDQLDNLRELKQTLNLKNVEFVGFKSGKELLGLIEKSRFTIVPSQWFENNPMNVIESFFMGKPVIGSKIGGIPELIEDGITGYLCDYNNSENLAVVIRKAWDLSEVQYKKIAVNCLEFAKNNFDANTHYEKLFKIYNNTITKSH